MNLAGLTRALERCTELSVPCDYCGSRIGIACRSPRNPTVPPHDSRRRRMQTYQDELRRAIEWDKRCLQDQAAAALRAPEPVVPQPTTLLAGGPQ